MEIKTGRRTIYIPKGEGSALFRILTTRGDENLSGTLDAVVDRYLHVLGNSMPNFTDAEWCLIFDATLSTRVSDTIYVPIIDEMIKEVITPGDEEYQGLEKKWEVEVSDFRKKLGDLTYAEKQTTVEMIELFRMVKNHRSYSDTIALLKEQFGSEPPDISDLKTPPAPGLRTDAL